MRGDNGLHWQVDKIPKMKHAQLGEASLDIGHMLFGEQAYMRPYAASLWLKEDICDFVSTLLSYLWNQSRKSVKRQFTQLENGREEVAEEYEST